MADTADRMLAALTRLLDDTHLAAPDEVPAAVAAAAGEVGWDPVVMYLCDYEQRLLVPIPAPGLPEREPLGIDSSLAGLAFQRVRPMHGSDDPQRLWVPLIDGVERLGCLEIGLPAGTDPDDPALQEEVRRFALLSAHLVSVKMPYGDGLDRHRRVRPRTVASELLWQLLPPLTYGTEGLVVSAVLEPSYEVAGDAFDYAVTDRTAYLLMLDSTGHDLVSGSLSAAALAAARKARREEQGLLAAVELVDETLATYFGDDRYATGVLAELDLDSGLLRYVNAGHPAPLLMRQGKVVKALEQGTRPMFGLGEYAETNVGTEQLQSGDWLVLYSDGVIEARDPGGAFFGVERLVDMLARSATADQRAPETLRRVIHGVLDYQGGVLQDDATLLVAEWASGAEHRLFPLGGRGPGATGTGRR
jgi:sigma-B regulation protein RsbU (phosphoserine phosphatase)